MKDLKWSQCIPVLHTESISSDKIQRPIFMNSEVYTCIINTKWHMYIRLQEILISLWLFQWSKWRERWMTIWTSCLYYLWKQNTAKSLYRHHWKKMKALANECSVICTALYTLDLTFLRFTFILEAIDFLCKNNYPPSYVTFPLY